MVEDAPFRWNDPIAYRYGQGPDRKFSAARFIGGSLRALYDDEIQPYPTRMTKLLDELATAITDQNAEAARQYLDQPWFVHAAIACSIMFFGSSPLADTVPLPTPIRSRQSTDGKGER